MSPTTAPWATSVTVMMVEALVGVMVLPTEVLVTGVMSPKLPPL